MLGAAETERFVQLQVEHPLAVLVGGVAVALHVTTDRAGEKVLGHVVLNGALVGLGQLVVEAPVEVVGQQAIQRQHV